MDNEHSTSDVEGRSEDVPVLVYRSGVDEGVDRRRAAVGCFGRVFGVVVTLACLLGTFVFAWLGVALLLLVMYPPTPNWGFGERFWVGVGCAITWGATAVCLVGAVRAAPIDRRGA